MYKKTYLRSGFITEQKELNEAIWTVNKKRVKWTYEEAQHRLKEMKKHLDALQHNQGPNGDGNMRDFDYHNACFDEHLKWFNDASND